MKHSSKPSVPGTSNETFPKTESTSSLQGSAESSSPDTSISNGGETHPSKIDALKNWFRTRPIVEKFCALPTYIQSWGLTLFFMGTATNHRVLLFSCAQKPDCQHRADLHSGGLFGSAFYGRIQLRPVLLLCRRRLRQFSVHVSVFRAGFHDGRLSDYLRGNVFNFQHYKRHHKQHENAGTRAGGT